MEKLRTALKSEISDDAAAQRVLEAITKDYDLIEKEPPPDRTFSRKGVNCEVWRRGNDWHIKAANGLVMNVEGHWTEDEVNAYAAEQIGLKETARRG